MERRSVTRAASKIDRQRSRERGTGVECVAAVAVTAEEERTDGGADAERGPHLERITVHFGQPLDPRQLAQEAEGDEPHERIALALHDHVAELAVPALFFATTAQ